MVTEDEAMCEQLSKTTEKKLKYEAADSPS